MICLPEKRKIEVRKREGISPDFGDGHVFCTSFLAPSVNALLSGCAVLVFLQSGCGIGRIPTFFVSRKKSKKSSSFPDGKYPP